MKKRLLASVLAALMVVGMMPEAFAADGTNERTDASVAETGGVYYNSLDTAIKNVSANGTVTLLKDTTTNAKYITVETPLTLDLGGNVLTAEQSGFDVYTNFTIKNGTVNTNRWGVWLQDETTDFTLESDATINADCNTTKNSDSGVVVVQKATANLYGTVTSKHNFAVSGNGTSGFGGVTINVNPGANIVAEDAPALYFPNSTYLTIAGGTITGDTGVYIKSGSVDISGGVIRGVGAKTDYEYKGNGADSTGDALVVETCKYPGGAPEVSITGGTFESVNANAIGSYAGNGETEPITGFISGGTFTNDVTEYCMAGKTALKISDNKFEVADIPNKDETVEIAEGAANKDASKVDASKVEGDTEAAQNITIDAAEVVKDENGLTDEEENDAFKALKTAGKITVDADGKITDETKITVSKNTYLDATVNSCKIDEDKGVYEVSMDITPKYTLTATTDKGDSVKLANEPKEMKVTAKTKVEVTLPSVFADKLVYINHDNKELYTATADENGKITFETNGFSPFTFTLTKPSGFDHSSGGGSSGGGSSSSSTYKVTVAAVSNGSAKVSSSTAAKDAAVTVTLSPDKGYKLDKITVTDASGKEIATTKKSDTSYTFTMPASAVTVRVTYVKDDTAAEEPTTGFNDVADKDWFADAVKYVADKGMMNGTSKTTFGPNDSTTRGMIVTVLYRLENEPSTSAASFTDVASGQYYTNAVAWANANSIVTGYGNGKFGPNDKITREQLAAILYRYAQYKGVDVGAYGGMSLREFADYESISEYARPAFQWAVSAGVVTGKTDNKIDPAGSATRAEVAAMLMRYCEKVAK